MKSILLGVVSWLSMLVVSGCGANGGQSGGEGGSGGDGSGLSDLSCDVSSFSVCSHYVDLPPNILDTLKDECATQKGTIVATCSTEDQLGCCALSQSGVDVSICYYSGGFVTLDSAQLQCSQAGGAWSYPDSGGSGGAKSYLFPTDVGNSWTYTGFGLLDAGNNDIVFDTTVTLPSTSSAGKSFAWSLVAEPTSHTADMFYLQNAYARDGDDILVGMYDAGDTKVSLAHTIHYDPLTGSSAGSYLDITGTWMPHEDVVTPAGEFDDCYVLLYDNAAQQSQVTNYFKRGVGPVKATVFYQGEEFLHYELVSYHVK